MKFRVMAVSLVPQRVVAVSVMPQHVVVVFLLNEHFWSLSLTYIYMYIILYSYVCYSYSFRKEQWNKKLTPLKKNWHLLSQTVFILNCKQATSRRVLEQARLPCDTRRSKPHLWRLLPLILLTEWPVDLYWLCIAPLYWYVHACGPATGVFYCNKNALIPKLKSSSDLRSTRVINIRVPRQ